MTRLPNFVRCILGGLTMAIFVLFLLDIWRPGFIGLLPSTVVQNTARDAPLVQVAGEGRKKPLCHNESKPEPRPSPLRRKFEYCISLFIAPRGRDLWLPALRESFAVHFPNAHFYILLDAPVSVAEALAATDDTNTWLRHDTALNLHEQITTARLLLTARILMDDCTYLVEMHDDARIVRFDVRAFAASAHLIYTPWMFQCRGFCDLANYSACAAAANHALDNPKALVQTPHHRASPGPIVVVHPWIVKVAALRAYGYYDPTFNPACYEDTDLAARWLTLFPDTAFWSDPHFVTVHAGGATRNIDLTAGNELHGFISARTTLYAPRVTFCTADLSGCAGMDALCR